MKEAPVSSPVGKGLVSFRVQDARARRGRGLAQCAHLFPVQGWYADYCLLEVCGVTFARVKGWVNLIKKLKLASVCFPEKKKKIL